ncbi:hypothetical protein [Paenibacillus cremeus]|uniref:hypothetical protein n=1 Tax=Paenibacillus cremeus TaxID=2163881 RepID=UPI0011A9C4E2|nr:hypothetical protein [Paenibacillus cremeus]
MKLTRKQILFNEDDAHQRELLEWVATQTTNFSGYVKDVLFAVRSGGFTAGRTAVFALPTTAVTQTDDGAGISDIFGEGDDV